jgi:hypothetical protein
VNKSTMIISLLASSRFERPDLRRYEFFVHFLLRISFLSEYDIVVENKMGGGGGVGDGD